MVEAIEKEKANALVPRVAVGAARQGDAPPAAAPRPEDHVTVARVLVTAHLPGDAPARLAAAGHDVIYRDVDGRHATGRAARARSPASTGSSRCSSTGSTPSSWMPPDRSLQVVANVAVGHDNVDVAACTERGVVVTNTPGVLTDATADIAMALVLMTTRGLGRRRAPGPHRASRGAGA